MGTKGRCAHRAANQLRINACSVNRGSLRRYGDVLLNGGSKQNLLIRCVVDRQRVTP
jgi:hypothetical protein